MDALTLHEDPFSGNCYKIRLTAALVGLKLEHAIQYDITKGETRTPHFLNTINRVGGIPVLQIGQDTYLPESNAACYYIATGSHLIPSDRLQHAEMLRWMFFEQSSIEPTVGTLRYWAMKRQEESKGDERKVILSSKRGPAESALDVMNAHLGTGKFFVGEDLTLADVALYGYTHVAPDAGFDLARWPNIEAWCRRISAYPGYCRMEC